MEPDRTKVEAQRKKLDTPTLNGGAKAEALYRAEWLKYQVAWNATPGLPRLV